MLKRQKKRSSDYLNYKKSRRKPVKNRKDSPFLNKRD